MTDWTAAAAKLLSEVGLTFEDVYDLGRDWDRVMFDDEEPTKPNRRGVTHPPSGPPFRSKPLIGVTGPIDCEEMLHILAHECGHALYGFSSVPMYIQEYKAERYANEAIERVLGRAPAAHIVEDGKAYVRAYCQSRYEEFKDTFYPSKGWDRDVIAWCAWQIPPDLLEQIERDERDRLEGR